MAMVFGIIFLKKKGGMFFFFFFLVVSFTWRGFHFSFLFVTLTFVCEKEKKAQAGGQKLK
jgi:hypothetical protein